jgi:hypothetical protein
MAASFDNRTLANGPGRVPHTDVWTMAAVCHPYRQCVSEVNAWLILWLFLNFVNMFVTRVEVSGKIDGQKD